MPHCWFSAAPFVIPPVCLQTKRELDGFCRLEWDVGSPLAASDLKPLTMHNGDTLAPRGFCALCGVRMGPRAWTWHWYRVFWFPAFFVRRRAGARASTGVFPYCPWWHLPLRGCFVAENRRSVKQRPRKRAMCRCPINSIPHGQLPSADKQQLRATPAASQPLHLVLQEPQLTREWSWPLGMDSVTSVLLLGVNILSAKAPAAPRRPNEQPGAAAADLEVALSLGAKAYCQSEPLQPCG